MAYDTTRGMPTKGSEYAQLLEHLRKAQENCAMLSHLTADNDKHLAQGWLAIAELMKRAQTQITRMAMKGMH
jgi:hypothetical protein